MNTDCTRYYCYLKTRNTLIEKPSLSSPIKIILFDMDGVLVDSISSWRHVHTHFYTNNDSSVDAYVRGKISDEEFIRRDVAQWKKDGKLIHKKELETIFSTVDLMKGAQSCIKTLKQYQVQVGIVSAGIEILASKVANLLDMDFVYANQLVTDSVGRLTGEGIVNVPLMKKDIVVKKIAQQLCLSKGEIAAVGNSCFDIPLLRSVGLGIAFHPDDDCVRKEADVVIETKDLHKILTHLTPYLDQKIKQ